jgi:hypothetical protein
MCALRDICGYTDIQRLGAECYLTWRLGIEGDGSSGGLNHRIEKNRNGPTRNLASSEATNKTVRYMGVAIAARSASAVMVEQGEVHR